MFNKTIPFNSNMLANVTRHSVGDIEKSSRYISKIESNRNTTKWCNLYQ